MEALPIYFASPERLCNGHDRCRIEAAAQAQMTAMAKAFTVRSGSFKVPRGFEAMVIMKGGAFGDGKRTMLNIQSRGLVVQASTKKWRGFGHGNLKIRVHGTSIAVIQYTTLMFLMVSWKSGLVQLHMDDMIGRKHGNSMRWWWYEGLRF